MLFVCCIGLKFEAALQGPYVQNHTPAMIGALVALLMGAGLDAATVVIILRYLLVFA